MSDDEAEAATEALELEQDSERAVLEAELAQVRSDRVEAIQMGGGDVDSSADDPDGLLMAEREAQRLKDAQLAAEAAKKRDDLANQLKLKRRKLTQQLKQIDASEEDVTMATEELELEHEEERHGLEAELAQIRSESVAVAQKAIGNAADATSDGDPGALLRAEQDAKRKLEAQLDVEAKQKREVRQRQAPPPPLPPSYIAPPHPIPYHITLLHPAAREAAQAAETKVGAAAETG